MFSKLKHLFLTRKLINQNTVWNNKQSYLSKGWRTNEYDRISLVFLKLSNLCRNEPLLDFFTISKILAFLKNFEYTIFRETRIFCLNNFTTLSLAIEGISLARDLKYSNIVDVPTFNKSIFLVMKVSFHWFWKRYSYLYQSDIEVHSYLSVWTVS